ncbi:MAG: nucleotidyltransferase domain-containing protein [Candidatus Eisenbacteria bacterium]|nr:nucleotidyltransferase domain-containing protein [Candidatus Eisenbacteria bacterium]
MPDKPHQAPEGLLASLQERAKELSCLYRVEGILRRQDESLEEAFLSVVEAIPPGWQYPEICRARVIYGDTVIPSVGFEPTEWVLRADITVQDRKVGTIEVHYLEPRPQEDDGPFLNEEVRLVSTIAELLGHFILRQRLLELQKDWEALEDGGAAGAAAIWRSPLHLLRESDRSLYLRIAHKMLNYLCQVGVEEARSVVAGITGAAVGQEGGGETNVPACRLARDDAYLLSDAPFELASGHLSNNEILTRVQNWMQEDKASSLLRVVNNPRSPLPEIVDAIRRFHYGVRDKSVLRPSTLKTLRVSLTQRLLTEQVDFVRVAKEHVHIEDFAELTERMILPAGSHGRLGGKSAGMILAYRILQRVSKADHPVGDVKIPRTWYLPSDGLLDFIGHNDLQDVIEQKFKEIDEVRQEYPDIIRLFKNSSFPPRMINGISVALDDFGSVPLIIRSSSLLEDRLGTAFSGKYKSLFLANQGTKAKQLAAIADAVAEVYASTFGPDPIEYRRERGLLEFNEEMGILIQEVVGKRVGKYFLPAFAGVAFSNSEFRWSPRIRREDGMIRLVPGLGTRAVDRVGDDYPILLVPGRPKLRANVAVDEIVRYSPRWVDVINLESGTLETKELAELLREIGPDYPAVEKVFSVLRGDMLQRAPSRMLLDPEKDELVATFDGLTDQTDFMEQMRNILNLLEAELGTPVDVEFAHDGDSFYLLQCRAQSRSDEAAPSPIPKDVAPSDIVFTADRHVTNGYIPDITHIVYVDPDRYAELPDRQTMLEVARAVGRLNSLLPRRRFILLGPGRWGSRGDVSLGVSVTYADISATAMLIEIARRKGDYVPDLSFGTHFFQDLVESRIRYLPLYPDNEGVEFNEQFLRCEPNLLPTLLPELAHLADTLRVIDVPACSDGRVLRVLLNADLDEALAMLAPPGDDGTVRAPVQERPERQPIHYWQWRLRMAERIAADLDPDRFGVVAVYVFGSTKNATAGPASDIDLLVHFRGTEEQETELTSWLEGWGRCLGEINYLRTGYRTGNLLDAHLITDRDIAEKNSYAAKIGAVTDPARELPLGRG